MLWNSKNWWNAGRTELIALIIIFTEIKAFHKATQSRHHLLRHLKWNKKRRFPNDDGSTTGDVRAHDVQGVRSCLKPRTQSLCESRSSARTCLGSCQSPTGSLPEEPGKHGHKQVRTGVTWLSLISEHCMARDHNIYIIIAIATILLDDNTIEAESVK